MKNTKTASELQRKTEELFALHCMTETEIGSVKKDSTKTKNVSSEHGDLDEIRFWKYLNEQLRIAYTRFPKDIAFEVFLKWKDQIINNREKVIKDFARRCLK